MGRLYLGEKASRARLREAARARENRREIVKALSQGQVSRRELLKWGLFTSAGLLAPIGGLNPFVSSAYATSGSDIPTGIPPSPLGDVQAFTQPMLRFDVLPRRPFVFGRPGVPGTLTPNPTEEANTTKQRLNPDLVQGRTDQFGPVEEIEADPVEVRKALVDKRTQIRCVGNAVVFTINQCLCLLRQILVLLSLAAGQGRRCERHGVNHMKQRHRRGTPRRHVSRSAAAYGSGRPGAYRGDVGLVSIEVVGVEEGLVQQAVDVLIGG